ncbi:MAG: hypothetical protein JKX78_11960 [Alteromonadaceae bacterium]|nr:hypothetical protein [Alteromonadaceae bacterium]
MDIFTTQIAQASQPITKPIKAEKLKVKALTKEARLGKLKKEQRELDENDYAFYHPQAQDEQSSSQQYVVEQEVVELSDKAVELEQQQEDKQANSSETTMGSPHKIVNLNATKKKVEKILKNNDHLDIFI